MPLILFRRNIIADDKLDLKQMKERFLAEGDLYEDGMYLKNGFFRKRKFAHQGSEVSMDLFSEDRTLDSGGEDVEEDSDDAAEVTRRRKRVEKEQFLKFIRVSFQLFLYSVPTTMILCTYVCHLRMDKGACWRKMKTVNLFLMCCPVLQTATLVSMIQRVHSNDKCPRPTVGHF